MPELESFIPSTDLVRRNNQVPKQFPQASQREKRLQPVCDPNQQETCFALLKPSVSPVAYQLEIYQILRSIRRHASNSSARPPRSALRTRRTHGSGGSRGVLRVPQQCSALLSSSKDLTHWTFLRGSGRRCCAETRDKDRG